MWRSGLVALVVFSVLTLGAVATMVALSGAVHEQQGWNAFDLVVVPATASIEELHAALDAEGLAPISAANATIRVEDFNGQAELPIADLSQRFDDADPRLDPFVRAVMRLFSIRQGETDSHVMYLPRSSSIFRRYRAINAAFEGMPFYLAGWQPMARVLSAVGAFLILFGVVVRARRRPVLSSTIAIFAVTYVFLQGPVALIGGVLTAIGVMYAVQRARPLEREWLLHRGRITLQRDHVRVVLLLVGGVGIAVTSLVVTSDEPSTHIAAYTAFLLSMFSAYATAIITERMRLYRREHRLFSPRPILGETWRSRRAPMEVFPGLRGAAAGLAVAIVVVYLYTNNHYFPETPYVPVPEHVLVEPGPITTSGDGVNLLKAASVIDPRQAPLSVAGFLAHRRYQSSVLFDGRFSVPVVDEVVTLRRFRREDGAISAWEEEQVRYNGAWVVGQYDVAPPSVYTLFVREGGVFSVVPHRLFVSPLPARLIPTQIVLLFIVVFPLLLPFRLPYRDGIGTVAIASRSDHR